MKLLRWNSAILQWDELNIEYVKMQIKPQSESIQIECKSRFIIGESYPLQHLRFHTLMTSKVLMVPTLVTVVGLCHALEKFSDSHNFKVLNGVWMENWWAFYFDEPHKYVPSTLEACLYGCFYELDHNQWHVYCRDRNCLSHLALLLVMVMWDV